MSEYIGSIGSKITVEAVYKKSFEYQTHFTYYGEWHSIHTFEDSEGNCIVWKSTGIVQDKKFVDQYGQPKCIFLGSKVLISATVKEQSEYKDVKQTIISRPRFTIVDLAKSPEEIQAEKEAAKELKRKEQLESISGEDFFWEMPYKQFKEHYSDCETLVGSYDQPVDERGYPNGPATIKVIIREGRLKNSGVRGQHFSGYQFMTGEGLKVCFRAVSEENARKQMLKEYPESSDWECTRIFSHRGRY